MRLSFEESNEFIQYLQMRFAAMVKTETLRLYGVPTANLKEYRAPAKKGQYAFENTPEEKYRLLDEEIPCQNDMLKQQK